MKRRHTPEWRELELSSPPVLLLSLLCARCSAEIERSCVAAASSNNNNKYVCEFELHKLSIPDALLSFVVLQTQSALVWLQSQRQVCLIS